MNKKSVLFLILAVFFVCTPLTPAHAFSVTGFGYSQYNPDTAAMDAAFGIDGLAIEDFADGDLLPGLGISAGYLGSSTATNWDDTGVWISSVRTAHNIEFTVGRADKFGIGLGQFENFLYGTQVDILVNGNMVEENFYYQNGFSGWYGESQRNMYVVVEAGAGEEINSVTLGMTTTGGRLDSVSFDHIAVNAIPEPATLLLLGAGLLGLAGTRRKARK